MRFVYISICCFCLFSFFISFYYCLFQLKTLLRDVLDTHSSAIQTAKLQRRRRYDDEIQHLEQGHPQNALQWAYIEQEDFIYDAEIDNNRGDNEVYEEVYEEEVLLDSQDDDTLFMDDE